MSIFLKEATNCRATANYQVFEYSLYLRKTCCILLCMRPCHSAFETKTETSAEWTRVMSRPRSLVHNTGERQHRMFSVMLARPVLVGYGFDLSEPEANNIRRVSGCGKNTPHRAVSLRQPRLLFCSVIVWYVQCVTDVPVMVGHKKPVLQSLCP